MSRHTIPAREPDKHLVVVGYDRPLDDFFITVFDQATIRRNEAVSAKLKELQPGTEPYRQTLALFEDDETILNEGLTPGQKLKLDKLTRIAAIYAVFPAGLTDILLAESYGRADTNIMRDWREKPMADPISASADG